MPEKGSLIETGVDRLLSHVKEEGQVNLGDAADSLGADRDTVMNWASSLEEANLIEIKYSARKGRVLTAVEGEVTEEKLEEAREKTAEELGKLEEFKGGEAELERVQEMLEQVKQELEDKERDALELEEILGRDHVGELERYRENLIESEIEIEELEERLDSVIAGLNVMDIMAEQTGFDVKEEEKGFISRLKSFLGLSGKEEQTFACSECGKEFGSQHGVKVHRGMVHGE